MGLSGLVAKADRSLHVRLTISPIHSVSYNIFPIEF